MADYELYAEILPELAKTFAASVQKQTSKALASVDADLKIEPQLDKLAVAKFKKQIAALDKNAKVTIKIDKSQFDGLSQLGRGPGAMLTSILALGPAALPILGSVAAGAAVVGASFAAAGAATGAFAVAATGQIKAFQDELKLSAKAGIPLEGKMRDLDSGVTSLKSSWSDFLSDTRGPVFDVFTKGLGIANDLMGKFTPLVKAGAAGISGALDIIKSFVNSSEFDGFLDFFRTSAPNAIRSFTTIGINVLSGVLSVFQAFAPMQTDMLSGLKDLTKKFRDWAASLSETEGFKKFLAYIRENGPKVLSMVGAIASAGIDIIKALTPFGPLVLTMVTALAKFISAIPPALLGIIAGAVIGLTLAFKGLLIVQSIAGAMSVMKLAIIALPALFASMATTVGLIPTALGLARLAVISFVASLTALQAATIVGAILAIVGAIVYFSTQAGPAKLDVEDLSRAFEQLAKSSASSAKDGKKAFDDLAFGSDRASKAFQQFAQNTKQAGVSSEEFRKGILGEGDAYDVVRDKLIAYSDGIQDKIDNRNVFDDINSSLPDWISFGATIAGIEDDAAEGAKGMATEWEKFNTKQKIASENAQILSENLGVSTSSLETYKKQLGIVTEATKDLSGEDAALVKNLFTLESSFSTASEKAGALKTAYATLYGPTIGVSDSLEAVHKSFNDLAPVASLAIDDTGRFSNETLTSRDSVQAALTSISDYGIALVNNGVPVDDASTKTRQLRDDFISQAEKAGYSREEIQKMIDQGYGKIPTEVKTDLIATNSVAVISVFDSIIRKVQDLMNYGYVPGAATIERERRAEGGYIRGPGSSTSDSIPAWLSNKEYVQRAAAVDYYGVDFMDALNQMRIPKRLLGYADGGRPGGLDGRPVRNSSTDKMSQSWNDLYGRLSFDMLRIPIDSIEKNAMSWAQKKFASGIGMGWERMTEIIRGQFPGISANADVNRQDGGYHPKGRALDIGPPWAAANSWIASNFPNSTQLIYTPGINLLNGAPFTYNPQTQSEHFDHVHWAMDKGGILSPGWNLAYNGLGRPEPLVPAGRGDKVELGDYTINRIAQAISRRPANLTVDGRTIAEVTSEEIMRGGLL